MTTQSHSNRISRFVKLQYCSVRTTEFLLNNDTHPEQNIGERYFRKNGTILAIERDTSGVLERVA